MATLFYFSLLNINNTDGLFIPRIINTFAALIKKAMKFDIKKHIYLILLFILSFTVETAQSQEVTNIHIAATDTVPTYTSDSAVINFLKDKEVISICPEVLAGMKIPRPCAEIVNGIVVDENGNDVNSEYNKAVSMALSKIQNEDIDLVILQSRSPTCGVNQIYDGSFTGKLISGMGFFAKALKQRGYNVIDVEEI